MKQRMRIPCAKCIVTTTGIFQKIEIFFFQTQNGLVRRWPSRSFAYIPLSLLRSDSFSIFDPVYRVRARRLLEGAAATKRQDLSGDRQRRDLAKERQRRGLAATKLSERAAALSVPYIFSNYSTAHLLLTVFSADCDYIRWFVDPVWRGMIRKRTSVVNMRGKFAVGRWRI